MTDRTGVGSRQDLGGLSIATAERIAGQRQAAALLAKLLERAAADGLPPIAWTLQRAGATMAGWCYATPADAQREEFQTWQAAITRWAGQRPGAGARICTNAGMGGWAGRLSAKVAARLEITPVCSPS